MFALAMKIKLPGLIFLMTSSTWVKKVLMFISNDFSGISDAIHSVFPASATQKCLVHFMRNCHKNLPANMAFDFIQQVKNIRDDSSLSFDEAVYKFENLCNTHKQANPTFIEYILKKKMNIGSL